MSKSIVQERILSAAPERVFEAWSDPAQLSQWMRPAPSMRPASVEVDFRVGGRFRITMHGERDHEQVGEYLEIDPPKRLVFSWVSNFLPEADRHTRVSVLLEPAGEGGTRIQLVHDQLPDNDTYEHHDAGWATILEHVQASFD